MDLREFINAYHECIGWLLAAGFTRKQACNIARLKLAYWQYPMGYM